MLPNANATVVTVMGLMSAGRVPAMINFTAGVSNILAACEGAELGAIVTSRAFVEKARLDKLVTAIAAKVKIVYLEDIRATVTKGDKIRGLLTWKRPLVDRKADDWAAILFTSGSEGVPKGVVLSHRNMLANAAQAAARIDFGRQDKVFNVLPMFHSFGLTVGVMLPLVSGVRIYLYPSPLHYRTVAELVYGVNATIMFGTDTFLNGYARVAHAYDCRSANRRARPTWRSLVCASWKAMASPRPRRCSPSTRRCSTSLALSDASCLAWRRGSKRSKEWRRAGGWSCAAPT
jgi:acyl-[acyl-carrier-protein]-phospholipid O-acyltransferase/long-chain-fatty-acid--[acyl-carrier-protein] ligase